MSFAPMEKNNQPPSVVYFFFGPLYHRHEGSYCNGCNAGFEKRVIPRLIPGRTFPKRRLVIWKKFPDGGVGGF